MTESASAPWGINGFFSPQFPCQFLTPPSSHQFTLSLVTKHSGHVAKIKPKILLPLFPFDLSCSQNLRIIVAPRKVIALHKNWEAVGRLHFEERTPNMHKTSFCVWVCSMKNKLYAVWYGPLTIFVVQKLRYMCIVHLAEAIPVPVHQVHQQIVTVFNFTSASGLGPKLSGSARLKLPPQDMEVLIPGTLTRCLRNASSDWNKFI